MPWQLTGTCHIAEAAESQVRARRGREEKSKAISFLVHTCLISEGQEIGWGLSCILCTQSLELRGGNKCKKDTEEKEEDSGLYFISCYTLFSKDMGNLLLFGMGKTALRFPWNYSKWRRIWAGRIFLAVFLVSVEFISIDPEMGDGEEEQGFYSGEKPDSSCKISNCYCTGNLSTAVFYLKFSADIFC